MNRRYGYSLLEVLIALTILMIGIIAVYRLFPISMREARMAEEKMIAAELADSTLGRLRASGVAGPTLMGYAESGDVYKDYTYLAISAAADVYALYDGYATVLQRMGGAGDIYYQRALFTVQMPDGRYETFATYVVEQ
ncbi:MAG: prepilin-type N-terminal cleavage/methylation domain-containing protein [Candidatus Hydrogenedentes bacterium]|nr:prepilin-type N-terminal cleavage/methylation domain-containing protein [Candidatus Hydrogenedentota bacterium]